MNGELQQRPPVNIVAPRRNQDVDIYSDPHSEARIEHMRLYPYYDQYGRPSGDSSNSARPAYDAYGRRVPFESYSRESLSEGAGAEPIWPEDQENLIYDNENDNEHQKTTKYVQQPSSNQYQPVISSNEAPVSPGQPGYADWLRRQYAARGQIPIGGDPGYEEFYRQYKPVQQSSSNQDFAQRNGQEPSSAYEVSQASGGSPGAVNYNTDFGGRRPGDPGYQRPKFYVNPQNGDAVPVPYSVGSGSQPATGRIGEGVQPDYRSNNFGSGVQPGQPGYDSSATGSNSIGNGAQPASADYTREVQPGQADYRSNIGRGAQPGNLIGSGAQPGQPGYDDRIPNSQIDFAGQPGSDERVRNIQPGHPNYRSNARAIGSGAQPGQSIGSGVQPGDSGSGSGSGYNNNIGHGVQPGSDGYNDDRRQQGGNGIGNGAEPNDISIPYNNQDGRAPNGQNYNIGSGADGRSAQDSDERYRNYDVYGRPLNPSNVVLPAPQNAGQQNFKLAKFRPRTIVRDSNGNFYEQRVENGKIYFYSDPHTGEEQKRIEIAELEPKISEELEGRRRQEANLRQLIENSRRSGEAPVQPISAAQKARRSSKTAQDQFFF